MPFEWNEEITERLLTGYRKYPCLWNLYDKGYSDANSKNKAFESIVKDLGQPGLSVDDCLLQLNDVTESFKEEQSRTLKGLKIGRPYESRLPWYELISCMLKEVIRDEKAKSLRDPLARSTTTPLKNLADFDNSPTREREDSKGHFMRSSKDFGRPSPDSEYRFLPCTNLPEYFEQAEAEKDDSPKKPKAKENGEKSAKKEEDSGKRESSKTGKKKAKSAKGAKEKKSASPQGRGRTSRNEKDASKIEPQNGKVKSKPRSPKGTAKGKKGKKGSAKGEKKVEASQDDKEESKEVPKDEEPRPTAPAMVPCPTYVNSYKTEAEKPNFYDSSTAENLPRFGTGRRNAYEQIPTRLPCPARDLVDSGRWTQETYSGINPGLGSQMDKGRAYDLGQRSRINREYPGELTPTTIGGFGNPPTDPLGSYGGALGMDPNPGRYPSCVTSEFSAGPRSPTSCPATAYVPRSSIVDPRIDVSGTGMVGVEMSSGVKGYGGLPRRMGCHPPCHRFESSNVKSYGAPRGYSPEGNIGFRDCGVYPQSPVATYPEDGWTSDYDRDRFRPRPKRMDNEDAFPSRGATMEYPRSASPGRVDTDYGDPSTFGRPRVDYGNASSPRRAGIGPCNGSQCRSKTLDYPRMPSPRREGMNYPRTDSSRRSRGPISRGDAARSRGPSPPGTRNASADFGRGGRGRQRDVVGIPVRVPGANTKDSSAPPRDLQVQRPVQDAFSPRVAVRLEDGVFEAFSRFRIAIPGMALERNSQSVPGKQNLSTQGARLRSVETQVSGRLPNLPTPGGVGGISGAGGKVLCGCDVGEGASQGSGRAADGNGSDEVEKRTGDFVLLTPQGRYVPMVRDGRASREPALGKSAKPDTVLDEVAFHCTIDTCAQGLSQVMKGNPMMSQALLQCLEKMLDVEEVSHITDGTPFSGEPDAGPRREEDVLPSIKEGVIGQPVASSTPKTRNIGEDPASPAKSEARICEPRKRSQEKKDKPEDGKRTGGLESEIADRPNCNPDDAGRAHSGGLTKSFLRVLKHTLRIDGEEEEDKGGRKSLGEGGKPGNSADVAEEIISCVKTMMTIDLGQELPENVESLLDELRVSENGAPKITPKCGLPRCAERWVNFGNTSSLGAQKAGSTRYLELSSTNGEAPKNGSSGSGGRYSAKNGKLDERGQNGGKEISSTKEKSVFVEKGVGEKSRTSEKEGSPRKKGVAVGPGQERGDEPAKRTRSLDTQTRDISDNFRELPRLGRTKETDVERELSEAVQRGRDDERSRAVGSSTGMARFQDTWTQDATRTSEDKQVGVGIQKTTSSEAVDVETRDRARVPKDSRLVGDESQTIGERTIGTQKRDPILIGMVRKCSDHHREGRCRTLGALASPDLQGPRKDEGGRGGPGAHFSHITICRRPNEFPTGDGRLKRIQRIGGLGKNVQRAICRKREVDYAKNDIEIIHSQVPETDGYVTELTWFENDTCDPECKDKSPRGYDWTKIPCPDYPLPSLRCKARTTPCQSLRNSKGRSQRESTRDKRYR